MAAAGLGHALHSFDVRWRVHLLQFLDRRRPGLQGPQASRHPLVFQPAQDALQATGVLRMRGQVVLQIDWIVNVGCIHACSASGLGSNYDYTRPGGSVNIRG